MSVRRANLDHLAVGAGMDGVVEAGEAEIAHQPCGLGEFVVVSGDRTAFEGIKGLGGVKT